MHSNYTIIRNFLKRSQFSYDDHQVEVTEYYMKMLFEKKRPEPYEANLDDFSEYISIMYPEHILYYKCYLHPCISEVIVYLVIERLQNKDLYATKRQIHALCHQAQERLNNNNVEDETHAANYMIKIFQSGEWHEPYDFVEAFPEYKKKLKDLHPIEIEKEGDENE